jgi:hypothetical protein
MKLNKNIAVSESGFIFNPLSGDSFSTNPLGQEIVRLLKEDKSKQEIIAALSGKYEADEATIEKDINDFFQVLGSYQLLINHE